MDVTSNLHPFFTHRLDVGPIRLATIAHAFNYRVAVLRDGVNSAAQVGRSRKAEGRILDDTDISWGQQVAVMFQIQEQPDNNIYYMYLSITPNLQVNYLYITFLLFGINGLNQSLKMDQESKLSNK